MTNNETTDNESVGTTDVDEQNETVEVPKEDFIQLFDSFNLFAEVVVEIREDGVPLSEKDDESLKAIEAQIDHCFREDTFMGTDSHSKYVQQYKEWIEQQGGDDK